MEGSDGAVERIVGGGAHIVALVAGILEKQRSGPAAGIFEARHHRARVEKLLEGGGYHRILLRLSALYMAHVHAAQRDAVAAVDGLGDRLLAFHAGDLLVSEGGIALLLSYLIGFGIVGLGGFAPGESHAGKESRNHCNEYLFHTDMVFTRKKQLRREIVGGKVTKAIRGITRGVGRVMEDLTR